MPLIPPTEKREKRESLPSNKKDQHHAINEVQRQVYLIQRLWLYEDKGVSTEKILWKRCFYSTTDSTAGLSPGLACLAWRYTALFLFWCGVKNAEIFWSFNKTPLFLTLLGRNLLNALESRHYRHNNEQWPCILAGGFSSKIGPTYWLVQV